jgi:predicted ArsR family transcriptional regulator
MQLERLLASTRGRILALLRTEDRTVNDLSTALDLTDNAVRAHLLSFQRDGLVKPRGIRRGRRKPHVTYGLSDEAEHIFPKAYGPLLNHFFTAISKRLSSRTLQGLMREVGGAVAKDHLSRFRARTRRERIDAALDLLGDLGGSARVEKIQDKEVIHSRNGCPLAAVSAFHPEACLIIESLLSTVIGVPAKTCCEYGETPHCCFELKR